MSTELDTPEQAAPAPAEATQEQAAPASPAPVAQDAEIKTLDGEPVKSPAKYIHALEEQVGRLASKSTATESELAELRASVAAMSRLQAENALLRHGVSDPVLAKRLAASMTPGEDPDEIARDIAARLHAAPSRPAPLTVATAPPSATVDDLPTDPVALRRVLLRRASAGQ